MGALLSLIVYHSVDYTYNPNYEVVDLSNDYFAKYSKGRVFIGDLSFLLSLEDLEENDILVLDDRYGNNPNMKVLNSSNICDKEYVVESMNIRKRNEF